MKSLCLFLTFVMIWFDALNAQENRSLLSKISQPGNSLFDIIYSKKTSENRKNQIPFPFSRLRNDLARRLGLQSSELKEILIPLGRALQREAAAPHYFQSPRHILVVDTEAQRGAKIHQVSAKDRLFIGYQEQSNSLEVISYNEIAGRFEFQIVDNYAPGKKNRIRYANRALCLSCHQNAAPIFPDAPWSETDVNPEIREHLNAVRQNFHGLRIRTISQAADHTRAIADAVERANIIPVLNLLWRRGCGEGLTIVQASKCRANLFQLALLRRLGTSAIIDANVYQNVINPTLQNSWRNIWPTGLPIPSHQIPDRDPFEQEMSITPELDPLSVREPHEIWHAHRLPDMVRVISSMAQIFEESAIRRLDKILADEFRNRWTQRQTIVYPCSFSRRTLFKGNFDRILFNCIRSDRRGSILNGYVHFTQNSKTRGRVNILQLPNGETQSQLSFKQGSPSVAANSGTITLQVSDDITGRSVRRVDGRALEKVLLRWNDAVLEKFDTSAEIPSYQFNGKAVLTFTDDVKPIRNAIREIIRTPEKRVKIFGDHVLSRQRLMTEIFRYFGLPYQNIGGSTLRQTESPPQTNTIETVQFSKESEHIISLFQKHCSECHASVSKFPPNFLRGNIRERLHQISICSERIAYRLAMWLRVSNSRSKSPMPPSAYLESTGVNLKTWPTSAELSLLLDHSLRNTKNKSSIELLLNKPYSDLHKCVHEQK